MMVLQTLGGGIETGSRTAKAADGAYERYRSPHTYGMCCKKWHMIKNYA